MWQFVVLLLSAFIHQCSARSGPLFQEPLHPVSSFKHLSLTNDLIAFHKNLTEVESITYNEEAVAEWLAGSLEDQGYHVERQYVDREAGRFNVYAYPGETSETKVLVSSHIDTVSDYHIPIAKY